ncbi:MAG TPA: ATP-binding cassette domain-containing protein [Polyangiaceae bacterium]|nr:ATP-binding cassette domain-containing protein [Polyangiaceae bacterium]
MIRLRSVVKSYERRVLSSLDLHVERGTLYGLVGPGAAGKSVVLKVIAGLVRPESGTVEVGETDVGRLDELGLAEHRKHVGMVFQNNALFDFMTVGENVAFPLRRLESLPEPEIQRRVTDRLARVGLPGFEARSPSGLSGGQKKRVAVARATVISAPVVLYDEPAAGLDPVSSQRLFDLLREEQRKAGNTVVMVSSDVDRLLTVTDRVGVMHEGRVVFEGSTDLARESDHPVVRQFLRGELEGPL